MSNNHFRKIEMKNKIYINVFCYENKLTIPTYISDKKFENLINLLLIFNGDKWYYVYINDFDRFMFYKTNKKNIYIFAKVAYSVLAVKMYWMSIKKFAWA